MLVKQSEGDMSIEYANQLQDALSAPVKRVPTDSQLNNFKSDLLELSELADSGDLSDELNLQPLLSHLYLLMKQAYDIAQSFRS
jgi:hypothetical protein